MPWPYIPTTEPSFVFDSCVYQMSPPFLTGIENLEHIYSITAEEIWPSLQYMEKNNAVITISTAQPTTDNSSCNDNIFLIMLFCFQSNNHKNILIHKLFSVKDTTIILSLYGDKWPLQEGCEEKTSGDKAR